MSRADDRHALFHEGDKFNRRGQRPRVATTTRPTLKGLHKLIKIQPLQGWSRVCRPPGALPPSIEFVPFGEKRLLIIDS